MSPEPQPPLPPLPTRGSVSTGPGWNLVQRLAFRFAFVYLILYAVPFPVSALQGLISDIREIATGEEPDPAVEPFLTKHVLKPYGDFWDRLVLRTGKAVFGVEIEYRPAGSGDTTWNYVQVFLYAVIAAAVTAVWSLAAWVWCRLRRRSRLGYPHLHEWLRVFVRFYLASIMISYGSVKVVKLQFSYPGPDTLLQTFGESSPMRLLWTFMGASDAYTWFTGAGELVAGILLCTRRTTLLGALVTFGVMVHVAALNFCYDVPVKLFSSHLVLMSVFLMVPDLPWLTRALVLGQPATARGYTPLVPWKWLDWTLFVVRTLLVLTLLGTTFYDNHQKSKMYGRLVPEPPLAGLWEVEEFSLDGKVRPPLTTDAGRWQRLTIRKPFTFRKSQPGKPGFLITNMPGKPVVFGDVAVDTEAKTITLTARGAKPKVFILRYTEPEPSVIEVEGDVEFFADGTMGSKRVKARLRHYGKDKFLLSSRGFHWINEVPYNRFGPRTEDPPKLPPPPKRP